MAKNDINKGLEKGEGLLKNQIELVGFLDEGFKSLGEKISNAFDDLTEGLEGNIDLSERLAKSFEKDITGSLKKMTRGLENNIALQLKINRGQNVEKDILKQKEALAVRLSKTEEQIKKVFADRPEQMNKILGMLGDLGRENQGNLDKLLDENTEAQRRKSLLELTLNPLKKFADTLDDTGTLSKILSGNFKDTFSFARFGQATMVSLFSFMAKAVSELSKIQTGLNKQFGFTDGMAMRIQTRFSNIANTSDNTLLSFRDINSTMTGIADATGFFAGTLRNDVVEGAAEAFKFIEMTNDQVALLALNAQRSGQSFNDQMLSMADGLLSAERTVGVTLDANKAFKTAASTTGLIRANLGRNLQLITKTVGEAQALGLTLDDLQNISSNLLNFQSSIEAELEAELFIGKQLNLERARLFALTGDYNNLQKEILKNVGSEFEFLAMNTLQKQKYAAALGMSVDQMSNLVMRNADLNAIQAMASARGREDIVDQMKALSLQQEFQKIVEKIQTAFVAIAQGPLGTIASLLSDALQNGKLLYGVLGGIAAIKLIGLVSGFYALVNAQRAAAVSGAAAKAAINPVAAIVTVGAAALAGYLIGETIDGMATKEVPLAEGGIVTRETRAVVGEAGAEAVLPLSDFYMKMEELFENQNSVIRDNKPLPAYETSTSFA